MQGLAQALEIAGALALTERLLGHEEPPGVLTQVQVGQRQPEVVLEGQHRIGHALQARPVGAEEIEHLPLPAEQREHEAMTERDVEPAPVALEVRELLRRRHGLLEGAGCRVERIPSRRELGDPQEIRDRFLGLARSQEVLAELIGHVVESIPVSRLEGEGHRAVEQGATRRQQALVDDLADAIVVEVESLAHGVQDAPTDELLDRVGGVHLVEARDLVEKPERERLPDDRGGGEGGPGPIGQVGQAADDGVADGGRQARPARPRRIQAADRFHDDERVSLAQLPQIVGDPIDDVAISPGAAKGAGQRQALLPGEPAERDLVEPARVP